MAKPTIILCPGAWHGPEAYSLVAPKLEDTGYNIIIVDWPSVSNAANVKSFDDDIEYLSSILRTEVDVGNEVVIVAHSWAGSPVSSTAEAFSKAELTKKGQEGGVVKLVFIAAFLAPQGTSIFDACGGQVPPLWDVQGDVVFPNDPENVFYNDLPEKYRKEWASKIKSHATATKYDKSRGAAYMSIPSWYLECELDQAIPIAIQEGMVKAVKEAGAELKVERLQSSHSPFLSKPVETVDFVVRAIES